MNAQGFRRPYSLIQSCLWDEVYADCIPCRGVNSLSIHKKMTSGPFGFHIALGKSMEPTILIPETEICYLNMATGLGEGKLWIQNYLNPLRIDLVSHSAPAEWLGKYIHMSVGTKVLLVGLYLVYIVCKIVIYIHELSWQQLALPVKN